MPNPRKILEITMTKMARRIPVPAPSSSVVSMIMSVTGWTLGISMILKIRKTTHIAVSKASRVSLCSW